MAHTHFFEFICSTLDTVRELFSRTPTHFSFVWWNKTISTTFTISNVCFSKQKKPFTNGDYQLALSFPSTTTVNTYFLPLSFFPLFYFQVKTNAFSILAAIGGCFWQLKLLKGILNCTTEHCPTLVTDGSISLSRYQRAYMFMVLKETIQC